MNDNTLTAAPPYDDDGKAAKANNPPVRSDYRCPGCTRMHAINGCFPKCGGEE